MVGDLPQRLMVRVFSFLLQAAVQVLRSSAEAITAAVGVLRSTLPTLTALGTCTSIRAIATWTTSAVAAVGLSVVFATNLSLSTNTTHEGASRPI